MAKFSKEDLQRYWELLKEWSEHRWHEFRENTIYFQIKAGLVIAYVAVAIFSIIIAIPSEAEYRVYVGGLTWGTGVRTYLDVHNDKLGTLNEVVLEVRGTVTEFDGKKRTGPWRKKVRRIGEGDVERVWPEDLLDAEHKPAGSNLAITRVIVYSADDKTEVFIDAAPTKKGKGE
jgi:hypothetical protein